MYINNIFKNTGPLASNHGNFYVTLLALCYGATEYPMPR